MVPNLEQTWSFARRYHQKLFSDEKKKLIAQIPDELRKNLDVEMHTGDPLFWKWFLSHDNNASDCYDVSISFEDPRSRNIFKMSGEMKAIKENKAYHSVEKKQSHSSN